MANGRNSRWIPQRWAVRCCSAAALALSIGGCQSINILESPPLPESLTRSQETPTPAEDLNSVDLRVSKRLTLNENSGILRISAKRVTAEDELEAGNRLDDKHSENEQPPQDVPPIKRVVLKEGKPSPEVAAVADVNSAMPPPEEVSVIDLPAALRLAGVDSPTINFARELVNEALGRQKMARAMMLPSLTGGLNYHDHTGPLQTSNGTIRVLTEQSFYIGAGAKTVAAESVAFPGVRIFGHLGDAIFEPLAARQEVEVRRSAAAATENQVLLRVSRAYFDLLAAEVRYEALRRSKDEIDDIVRRTTAYAREGQGRAADANRARTRANLLIRRIVEAEGNVAVASAVLAGLLNLDTAVRLRTPGGDVLAIQLIDEHESLEKLIDTAMVNRPEMRERLQALSEAQTRVRQEQWRPFLPLIGMGFSAGLFGGGSNLTANGIAQNGGGVVSTSSFGNFGGRTDLDVFAVWTLQNAGVGNHARVGGNRAIAGQALAQLEMTRNRVRDEVSEALAEAQASGRQLEITRRQLAAAQDGYKEEVTRIKLTVGRPLELIDSFRLLNDARLEMLKAIVDYDATQYQLLVAVGYSPLLSPAVPVPQPAMMPRNENSPRD